MIRHNDRAYLKVRDLLTEDDLPLQPEEWRTHNTVTEHGVLLVTLFGPKTQAQAIQILTDNAPELEVEPYLERFILIRRKAI